MNAHPIVLASLKEARSLFFKVLIYWSLFIKRCIMHIVSYSIFVRHSIIVAKFKYLPVYFIQYKQVFYFGW